MNFKLNSIIKNKYEKKVNYYMHLYHEFYLDKK